MEEKSFFQSALADFTYETACGGAIRHLTDLGYTVRQIAEQLDFPLPYERVRRAVWQRLTDTEVILLEEPGSGRHKGRAVYVREYDEFGRASFRRTAEDAAGGSGSRGSAASAGGWKERHICGGGSAPEELAYVLHAGTKANGREAAYVSCDFGLTAAKAPEEYKRLLEALEGRQREYVEGLPWEKRRVFHRLDPRMTEILLRLFGKDCWHGACYFLKTYERIVF